MIQPCIGLVVVVPSSAVTLCKYLNHWTDTNISLYPSSGKCRYFYIRLYGVKGMHLNFICPFFFWTDSVSKKQECTEIAKTFSAQQKMTHVVPRQTWMPSNFWKKKNEKGTFQLMTTNDMIFRVKKIFTHFFRLHKGEFGKNSINLPFWWYIEKDEVSSIHLMSMSSDLSHRFFVRFDGQQTGRYVPFTSYSLTYIIMY